jgi:hypothetical protein
VEDHWGCPYLAQPEENRQYGSPALLHRGLGPLGPLGELSCSDPVLAWGRPVPERASQQHGADDALSKQLTHSLPGVASPPQLGSPASAPPTSRQFLLASKAPGALMTGQAVLELDLAAMRTIFKAVLQRHTEVRVNPAQAYVDLPRCMLTYPGVR